MATIHIYTDADCEIFDFSEYVGNAIKGKDNTINLIRGRHKLRFFNMENCIDSLYVVQAVDADSMVDFIELDFSSVKAERYSGLDKLGIIRQEYIDSLFKGTGGILGLDDEYTRRYYTVNDEQVMAENNELGDYDMVKYGEGIFLFECSNEPERIITLNLNHEVVEIGQDKINRIRNKYVQEKQLIEEKKDAERREIHKYIVDQDKSTGKYGFLTRYDKKPFLPYIFDAAQNFDNDIAPVIYLGKKCIINLCGKIIGEVNLPNFSENKDGLPVVKDDMAQIITEDGKIGFFNHMWDMVISPKYYAPYYQRVSYHSFYDGYCIVGTKSQPGDKSMVIINKRGEKVSLEADYMFHQFKYDSSLFAYLKYPFTDMCACPDIIYAIDNKMGILSNSGKIIIPAEYEDITPFNDYGIAAAIKKDVNGKEYLCMIDRENRILRMMLIEEGYTVFLGDSLAPTVFDFCYLYPHHSYSKEDIDSMRIYNHDMHNERDNRIGPKRFYNMHYGIFYDNKINYDAWQDKGDVFYITFFNILQQKALRLACQEPSVCVQSFS